MLHDIIRLIYIDVAAIAGLVAAYIAMARTGFRKDMEFAAIAAILVFAVLGISGNLWLSFALLVVISMALFQKRERIAGLMMFSILIIPNISMDVYAGGVRLVDIGLTDAISLSAMVILLTKRGRGRPAALADMLAFLFVVLFVFFEARDTTATNVARVATQKTLEYLVPYWVITRSLRTSRDVQTFMAYMIAAGCVLTTLLLVESFTGWVFFREIVVKYGLDGMWQFVKWRNGMLRAAGPFLESTSMAFGLVFIALAAWHFRSLFSSRSLHYGIFGLLCIGIYMCQARNAILGLAIGLVASEAYRRFASSGGRWILPFVSLGLALAPIAVFLRYTPNMKAADDQAGTVDYRYQLFVRGMEEARKSLSTGTNMEVITSRMADLRQGEHIIDFVNSYIYVLLLSGVVGLFTFIFIIAYGIFVSIGGAGRKNMGGVEKEAMTYIFGMSVTLLPMLFFTFFGGRISVLLFMMVGLAGCAIRLRSQRTERVSRPARGLVNYELPVLR